MSASGASAGRLRLGILSTAHINDLVLPAARACASVEVVAVASRDGDRAAAYAGERGIARSHADYDALLADPDVDAVYVPLPNALHHRWALRALEAGKHVLCEKPYSRRPGEVEQAFALAQARGLVLSEAFMYRYNPQTLRLCELVREGALGELRLVSAAFTWRCDEPGHICLDTALDGGSLMDVGCYCVSAARMLAGEPLIVTAQWHRDRRGVELAFAATMQHPGGVLCRFESSLEVPERSELEVVGTHGSVVVHDPWHCNEPGLDVTAADGSLRRHEMERVDSYRLELDAFAAAVRGERASALGREDALGQARTLAALVRAAETGCAQRPADA